MGIKNRKTRSTKSKSNKAVKIPADILKEFEELPDKEHYNGKIIQQEWQIEAIKKFGPVKMNKDMARLLGVSKTTYEKWKKEIIPHHYRKYTRGNTKCISK